MANHLQAMLSDSPLGPQTTFGLGKIFTYFLATPQHRRLLFERLPQIAQSTEAALARTMR
jgi:hypothetical protein